VLCDGVSSRVSLGNLNVAENAMSISVWLKADDLSQVEGRIISKASGVNENQHEWMLSQISGSGLRFRLKTSGQTTTLASAAGEIEAGE